MNKYDELIERAKRFTDTAIVGELINVVSELKDREEVVHCRDCKFLHEQDAKWVQHCVLNAQRVENDDFCSYGEKNDG